MENERRDYNEEEGREDLGVVTKDILTTERLQHMTLTNISVVFNYMDKSKMKRNHNHYEKTHT